MPHFFERRDPWGHGLALWVLVAFAFVTPLAFRALSGIGLENDVENWLPHDDPQAVILRWYRDHFPIEDRVLMSWTGNSLHDPRIDKLKAKLEGEFNASGERVGGVEFVEDVFSPQDVLARMRSGGVGPETGLERLTGVLVGAGPLRVRLNHDWPAKSDSARPMHGKEGKEQLLSALRQQFDLPFQILNSAQGTSSKTRSELEAERQARQDAIPTDDDEPLDDDGRVRVPELAAYDFGVFWPGMHESPEQRAAVQNWLERFEINGQPVADEVFLQPGSPVALTAVLSPAAKGHTSEVLQAIRQAARDVGIPAEEFRMGGRPVAGSELNRKVKQAGWNRDHPVWLLPYRSPLLMCGVVGVLLALVMLRSLRLTVLVIAVTFYTVILAVAVVPLTDGSMNMVLVVMPPLLSVLTMSAAIHMANYWKHAAVENPATAVVRACEMARTPCVLASLTTSIGLMSLMTSPLQPVEDFGYYSAIGCLIALTVVLYALPALLQYFPARVPQAEEIDHVRWQKLAGGLIRHWKAIVVSAVVLFSVSVAGLQHFRTETKVIRYFPDHARVVQDYNFLEEQLSGIVPVDVVIRFDDQSQRDLNFHQRAAIVRDVEQAIRSHPEISGTISLADFLKIPDALPPDASTPRKILAYRRANETEKRVKGDDGTGANSFLTSVRDTRDLALGSGRVLNLEQGEEIWRITAQVAVMSDLSYADLVGDFHHRSDQPGELNLLVQSVLRRHPGTEHVVTGMVPLFLQTQQAVLNSLIVSFAAAFGLIGVVLVVLLRSLAAGFFTMLPNVLPVGVVFGLISWARLPVDIGTMITASVALGIAIDGTLHLLTWFRAGIENGLSRGDAIKQGLMHCGPALWQTSAAVGLGLLMLAQADLLLVSRFGWLMAALIGAALVADVIILPALLAGPLGTLIERTILAAPPERSSTPSSSADDDDRLTATTTTSAELIQQ